jgi:hypothetical protein
MTIAILSSKSFKPMIFGWPNSLNIFSHYGGQWEMNSNTVSYLKKKQNVVFD